MIVWFRFQNYGSFWHNTLISMQSGIYREHPEHLVPGPKGSLLKTLAIYGPNSSGKSQLINALAFYAAFVRRQLPFSPDSLWNLPGSGSLSGLSYSCCQNRNAAGSSPLSMSMCFFFHGHTFEYGFTLEEDVLTEEYLIVNQTLLFQKDQTLLRPGKALRPLFKRDVQLHTSGSGLPVIFAYAPENMEEALESFAAFFREGSFFFLSRDSFRQLSDVSSLSAEKLLSGEKEQRFLLHHLKAMGLPASKEALLTAPLSDGQQKTLLFLHTLFSLSRTGGVVIADDLTVFLHPNVSRYLVQLIQSPRNSNIQLLFTTHDTALLDHDLFRRDEAAIINLDAEGRSRIHTLADIRIRFDANFAREYLSGKYGLLPVWDQEE